MFAPGLVQPLGFLEVGPVDLGVVLQLARALDAVRERLTVWRILVAAVRFEQVTSFLRQRDDGGVAVDPDGLDEAGLAEVPQIAVTRVEGLVEGVAQVVRRDDAEGADGGQRAALGTTEHVAVVAHPDVLAFLTTRQVDVAGEHLARLDAFPLSLARVATAASAAAQVARAAIAVARVIVRSWVVHRHTSVKSSGNCTITLPSNRGADIVEGEPPQPTQRSLKATSNRGFCRF